MRVRLRRAAPTRSSSKRSKMGRGIVLMRRSLLVTLLALVAVVGTVASGALSRGYAQTSAPQGDEFNSSTFAAPFAPTCAHSASQPCPDQQTAAAGRVTWSLNAENPGQLRIWTQFGSILGTGGSTNNARNLILQPFSGSTDFTATTQMTFPATFGQVQTLGQTAGLIVYQNDDNFIFVGRTLNTNGIPALEFVQEVNGVDTITSISESTVLPRTVYLRLIKTGNTYQGFYSYDNVVFTSFTSPAPTPTPVPTSTATATATSTAAPTTTSTPPTAAPTSTATATATSQAPVNTTYTAAYTSPSIGLFAFGGLDTRVNGAEIPADFDWFRVGNSQTPAPSPQATVTSTATNTSIPAATSTATATATATATNTATNTPLPTSTPKPKKKPAYVLRFRSVSLWYHVINRGHLETIIVQANHKTKLGIWMHVIFPSGVHLDFYENTNKKGHWVKHFVIPTLAGSPYSPRAWVMLQLWHGKTTDQFWMPFTII
jgi:Beta xylosidase C-terminal Concanavalin A-like domain